MLEKGIQEERLSYSFTELKKELDKFDGQTMSEDDAKYWLYKSLRANPAYAAELFLGIRLFPFQTIAIKGMMLSDYSMMVWSRGASKCSRFDELCWTTRGLVKMMDVEVGDYVQSKDKMNRVLAKTINSIEKTYKVSTQRGFCSEGLDYHRVLVLDPDLEMRWKFAKDIKVGEYLVMKRGTEDRPQSDIFAGYESKGNPKAKPINYRGVSIKDWYYFFGLLLGDGCLIPNVGICVSSGDQEIVNFLVEFAKKIGLYCGIQDTQSNAKSLTIGSIELYKLLMFLGFEKVHTGKKEIPSKILNCSLENSGHLLSGLFDTDGYCALRHKPEKNANIINVGFTNTSETLLKQVRGLLLNLGILSSTQVTFKGGESNFSGKKYICNKAWSITSSSRDDLLAFREKVGFRIKRKADKLDEVDKYLEASDFGNYIPYVGDFLKEEMDSDSLRKRPHVKVCFRKNTSRTNLKKILELNRASESTTKKLQSLNRDDLFFEPVLRVEESEAVTVDLTVEHEACYVSDGIINHNSFSTAVYIILECLLSPNANIGVIANNFRQAKMIFMKIQDILSKPEAKLARDCVSHADIVKKGTDMWELKIGNSKATALPMANGERLRGFRFNRIVLDEFIVIPEKIFKEVLLPFIGVIDNPTEREDMYNLETEMIDAGLMEPEKRYVWPNNKLIILSSPSFKFEYMYKLYKKYEALIFGEDSSQEAADLDENGEEEDDVNVYRFIMQIGYDSLPKQLYDAPLLKQAKATMSEMQFLREFGGQFVDESDGYYRLSKMAACTVPDGERPTVEIAGNPADEYTIAFDPNWAGNSSADHFAMHVFKLLRDEQKSVLIHSYAIAGVDLKEHMRYFLYLLLSFNIVGICGDYNGGVQFIASCNESELFKKAGVHIHCIDEVNFDHPEEYHDELLLMKEKYDITTRKYCFLRKPSSNWIRIGNEQLQAAIDHRRIIFASKAIDDDFIEQRKKNIPIEQLKYDLGLPKQSPEAMKVDFIDHQKTIIELTKSECANIEVIANPQGSQSFQLPQNLKRQTGPNRARKDSYSALVLGNWFNKILFDMGKVEAEKKPSATFVPFTI
jgi:intein/homing endonuclease